MHDIPVTPVRVRVGPCWFMMYDVLFVLRLIVVVTFCLSKLLWACPTDLSERSAIE